MLKIVRAEDGELFQVDATLRELERIGSLEQFLQEQTGVDRNDVLAYLPDGTRLTTENIRELTGSQDDRIYVYNKYYLDNEGEDALKRLLIHPRLQPPIEDIMSSTPPFRSSQLAATYLQAAHFHRDVINHVTECIVHQQEALGISSHTLDLHILSLSETYDSFIQISARELEKQDMLLRSLAIDLDTIQKIQVHPDFLGEKFKASGRTRTLGSYVDAAKMGSVAEHCKATHEYLQNQFNKARDCMERLREGSDTVRLSLHESHSRNDATASKKKAMEAVERITDIASRLEGPLANSDALQELKQLDAMLREEVKIVTDLKNKSSETCMRSLQFISSLNNDVIELPTLMGSLQIDVRVKAKFSHIQRLHSMPYAYGATLIEIVRRKEFAHFFQQRASTIFEIMANLSSSERKRRQIYRGEVHGQLPFEEPIPDEPIPSIKDLPAITGKYEGFSIDRRDVDNFLQVLAALEDDIRVKHRETAEIEEARKALGKLFERMSKMEVAFDRIAERSLLSASTLSSSRRRILAIEESTVHDLSEKITNIEREKGELQQSLLDEQARFRSETSHLRVELEKATASVTQYKEQAAALEKKVESLKAQNESDLQTLQGLDERHAGLLAEIEILRKERAEALEDANVRTTEVDRLRQELAHANSEYEVVKTLEVEHSRKIAQLVEDQATVLQKLDEAHLLEEELRAQVQGVKVENEEISRVLRDVRDQKDRLLRAQTLEHQRLMRDHIAEADGDRAVLERQFFEARAQLEQRDQQLEQMKSEAEILHADNTGLREELLRTEHELREARHAERVLRNDLSEGRASQSDFEQKIAERDIRIGQFMDVAMGFRDSHAKAFATLQPLSIHPATALRNGTNPSESIVLTPPRLPMSPLREESTPIDTTDQAAALEILRSYDLDAFAETISKVGSVFRRWQKVCKDYRERAKGKITFRNFAKGDLALFLPTRNSPSKPWAAFNVSFPHYFLNATGRLAEQLKTREWIVARITSITERVVDARDPTTNPYGLGDGTKYFLLEVEDWTKPGNDNTRRRKSTGQKSQDRPISPPPLERPISPPLPDDRQANTSAAAAEPLGPTRSPNSHLFPVRTRSNSNPAGPSSLSRLLAQASAETPLDTIPGSPSPTRSRTPSPSARAIPAPPSPTRNGNTMNAHSPSVSSPLRPGSRASGTSSTRLSFSGGRIAPFPRGSSSGATGVSKAAPTTALSSELPVASPPSSTSTSSRRPSNKGAVVDGSGNQLAGSNGTSTPSPTQSVGEGLVNVLARRRTTSEHVPASPTTSVSRQSAVGESATATSTFANLVGMTISLGRRKRISSTRLNGNLTPSAQPDSNSDTPIPKTGPSTPTSSNVAETLRRFQP